MSPQTMTSTEVYLLPLNDNGSPDVAGEYIYLAPRSNDAITVRFAIEGTSSICRHGSLWVNIPEQGVEFRRDSFRQFQLKPDFNRTIEISVPVYHPGAFAFYVTYAELPELEPRLASEPEEPQEKDLRKTPLYYINVAPRLQLDGRPLPLPALSIFSVIGKLMGKYPTDWDRHLRSIADRGYNMVHFTPLQTRGASNSPFSLYDQLAWDPQCFPRGEADVQDLVTCMEKKHSLLSLTDVVLNHTANNTKWLEEHPEAGYNMSTAPWLESAYELDTKLLELSHNLESMGLPVDIKSTDELLRIMDAVKEVIGKMRLWEYYVLDVDGGIDPAVDHWVQHKTSKIDVTEATVAKLKSGSIKDQAAFLKEFGLRGLDRLGERFRRKIDPSVAAILLFYQYGRCDGADSGAPDKAAAKKKILELVNALNVDLYKDYDTDIKAILDQLYNRIKYLRLDDHGPKLGPINDANPLIETYFTRLPSNKTTSAHKAGDLALVNNGWVWAANALVDNAGPDSRVYLRREVIVWGDCVKLRYGSGPQDSPWLWEHMTAYARMLAKFFNGFRIDNCHSTPIHVAEHILDEARRIRPDLYIVAELFTGSEEMDYVFVKRLGISSLVREAMQAWSTAELSRLVHKHGGRPIGSFEVDEVTRLDTSSSSTSLSSLSQRVANVSLSRDLVRRIKYTPVNALFMDCTHDNEMPAEKRDARDSLPNAALVNMCSSATGSVMGYDEIYPRLVDLVHEKRLYLPWSNASPLKPGCYSDKGIGGIKKLLNQIHTLMGKDGYDETHIHHEDQYITVHRVHPKSRKGYFLIAHTAFPGYGNGNGNFSPVRLTGTRADLLGSWTLEVDSSADSVKRTLQDAKYLRGLPSRVLDVKGVDVETQGDNTVISVPESFPPGSIALFETWIPTAEHSVGLDTFVTSGAKTAWEQLDLIDLNFLMYRCEAEELDWSGGRDGTYNIPNHGKLVYAGLQGWWSVLKNVIRDNSLAHPLCQNLRDGKWALDYIVGRVERMSSQSGFERLAQPAKWLTERFDAIRTIPSFLLPRYFGLVLRTAYQASWDRGMELMCSNVAKGQWFLQSLAMVSAQQTGYVKSASLWPDKSVPCIAAGLPHFAVEWARCWGRDVFISIRGLFLGTGRFDEAKEHILAFASVLKHGMIPNLLSSGDAPRYNSRDSIWFFLQAIQDYVYYAPQGVALLKEKVRRRFLPYDDTWFATSDARAYSKESSIEEVIQEALQRHASGIKFREANAGPQIDSQMKDQGFNQDIKVDWETGFVFGGNQFNCGTWMDKMGESERAGSKGVPGTPRDGAAVEITGLLYSTVAWLASLHKQGQYANSGVTTGDGKSVSFGEWADVIKANFERCYYVPLTPQDDAAHDVHTDLVNRRGMYKDVYRSGKAYEDYQLRPNFAIAMTVAPALFDAHHAMTALCLADQALRGPAGMATLDPADLNYRPYYRNSDDSDDFATSRGRNYHQGPEWLWPTGFFLRALLKFDLARRASAQGRTEAFQQVTRRLGGCKRMMAQSEWVGLAELTQKGGEFCPDSSPTQAWSAGCLIDLYMDALEEQRHNAAAAT